MYTWICLDAALRIWLRDPDTSVLLWFYNIRPQMQRLYAEADLYGHKEE
jgi:hypothetical protein